jgi:3D (Asp-Asp-Asp) domain-containing protein
MSNTEASESKPHKNGFETTQYKSIKSKSNFRTYKWTMYLMLIVLAVLISYNLITYCSYYEVKKKYDITYQDAKTIMSQNGDLNYAKSTLKNENSKLKEDYSKIKQENETISKLLNDIKKQNDELIQQNKELANDNVELQNSLKTAASVGIKPQNFTKFEGITSRDEIVRGTYTGRFLGTAYTPSKEECGNNLGITNSGKPIIPGVSVAIDGKYWPFGTVFYIKGLGYAVAMDTGSAIKGRNRFDFAVFNEKFAMALGSKYWDVYVVRMGNGNVNDISL